MQILLANAKKMCRIMRTLFKQFSVTMCTINSFFVIQDTSYNTTVILNIFKYCQDYVIFLIEKYNTLVKSYFDNIGYPVNTYIETAVLTKYTFCIRLLLLTSLILVIVKIVEYVVYSEHNSITKFFNKHGVSLNYNYTPNQHTLKFSSAIFYTLMLGITFYIYNYLPLTLNFANTYNECLAKSLGINSSICFIDFGFFYIYASDAQAIFATILSISLGYYRSIILIRPKPWNNLTKVIILSICAAFVRIISGTLLKVLKIGGKEGITVENLF